LNKKPVIATSELKNSDYKSEMLNLVTNDSQREDHKQAIIAKISQIRNTKLEPVRQIITQAQEILTKAEATKEEVGSAINDLKILANAATDSTEKIV
jgi:ABC-type transporter Mla subunit MlaD